MGRTAEERRAALVKRREKANAQIRRLDRVEKAAERKKDTRRKILIGGVVLARIKAGKLEESKIRSWLDNSLTKDRDRELFGLDPSKKD